MWTPFASYSNLEAKPFISVCECYKKPTIMHIFRESSSNGLSPCPYLCKKWAPEAISVVNWDLVYIWLSYPTTGNFTLLSGGTPCLSQRNYFVLKSHLIHTADHPCLDKPSVAIPMAIKCYEQVMMIKHVSIMSYECSYIEYKVMLLQY